MPAKPDIIATEEETKKPDNEDGLLLYLAIKVKDEFKDTDDPKYEEMRYVFYHKYCSIKHTVWIFSSKLLIYVLYDLNFRRSYGLILLLICTCY